MSFDPPRGYEKIAKAPPAPPKKAMAVQGRAEDAANLVITNAETFRLPEPPPGVLPVNVAGRQLAMDYQPGLSNIYSWAIGQQLHEGLRFLGYQYLAQLTQRAEYRRVCEIMAQEMTRRWIKLHGADEKKLGELMDALARHEVQHHMHELALQDGFFGKSHLYIDLGDRPDSPELIRPLRPDFKGKIGVGTLKGFKVIEPTWTYPGQYNAQNPLASDFYNPQTWFVMGQTISATRLLTFIGREMPDILKPVYQFGGLSRTQMLKAYVDNWLRTRQSVSDLVHSFSALVLKSNLQAQLQSGEAWDSIWARMNRANQSRDNKGVWVIDKDTEELDNVMTSLANLDKLQAQSQEQIASIAGIPLVVLLGVTPSGLNASSDGEIATFHTNVHAEQERFFRKNLRVVINAVQMDTFGSIDPAIGFEFNPLGDADPLEDATIRKTEADTAAVYISAGVISNQEERDRLAEQEGGLYGGLTGEAPELEDDGDDEGSSDE